jgi:hypothetical protein
MARIRIYERMKKGPIGNNQVGIGPLYIAEQ